MVYNLLLFEWIWWLCKASLHLLPDAIAVASSWILDLSLADIPSILSLLFLFYALELGVSSSVRLNESLTSTGWLVTFTIIT